MSVLGAGAFLDACARASLRRVEEARERIALPLLKRWAGERLPARRLELSARGFDLFAEVKFASPAAGRLVDETGGAEAAVECARRYAGAGACAISVLTEPERFGGSLTHLERVAATVHVPVMRKDFLVDPYQVWEARAAGADGVLLIARLLSDELLSEMLDVCETCGLFALVEAFEAEDLERAARILQARPGRASVLVGVNARDLTTLEVDHERCERLAAYLPQGFPAVAESGLVVPHDARRVARAGYGLALVGTALMQNADPGAAARAFLEEGRAGRRQHACPSP